MEHIERKVTEGIDELQDKIDVIMLKHQLIVADIADLKQEYASPEEYGIFIDILNVALTLEPAFFLLDDTFIKKAEDILYSKRFDYMNVENYNEVINEIIGKLNILKTKPRYLRTAQVKSYIAWNLEVRQLGNQISQYELYNVLSQDGVVLSSLIEKDLSEIAPYYFFSSTNYLATVVPEIYRENPEIQDITMEKLDESTKKKGFWNWAERDFARATAQNIQKTKKNEE